MTKKIEPKDYIKHYLNTEFEDIVKTAYKKFEKVVRNNDKYLELDFDEMKDLFLLMLNTHLSLSGFTNEKELTTDKPQKTEQYEVLITEEHYGFVEIEAKDEEEAGGLAMIEIEKGNIHWGNSNIKINKIIKR